MNREQLTISSCTLALEERPLGVLPGPLPPQTIQHIYACIMKLSQNSSQQLSMISASSQAPRGIRGGAWPELPVAMVGLITASRSSFRYSQLDVLIPDLRFHAPTLYTNFVPIERGLEDTHIHTRALARGCTRLNYLGTTRHHHSASQYIVYTKSGFIRSSNSWYSRMGLPAVATQCNNIPLIKHVAK